MTWKTWTFAALAGIFALLLAVVLFAVFAAVSHHVVVPDRHNVHRCLIGAESVAVHALGSAVGEPIVHVGRDHPGFVEVTAAIVGAIGNGIAAPPHTPYRYTLTYFDKDGQSCVSVIVGDGGFDIGGHKVKGAGSTIGSLIHDYAAEEMNPESPGEPAGGGGAQSGF